MSRRRYFLKYSLHLLFAGVILLSACGEARAHRLLMECHVLPGGEVQVESWFDLTGKSPKGALVQVFQKDGKVLVEGPLNEEGVFVFSVKLPQELKVAVYAGAGHRAEQQLSPEDWNNISRENQTILPDTESPQSGLSPRSDRRSRTSAKDVLVGVGFLLALAALGMSLRNSRQLKKLANDRSQESQAKTQTSNKG